MSNIKRDFIQTIPHNLDTHNGKFHVVITEIVVNNSQRFIECYVGVNKYSSFYHSDEYIEPSNLKCAIISRDAFTKYGSKKYFDHESEFAKVKSGLDGAWLTFHRNYENVKDDKSYKFLLPKRTYYGSGFLIRDELEVTNRENSIQSAIIQADRIMQAILDNEFKLQYDSNRISKKDAQKILFYSKFNKNSYIIRGNNIVFMPKVNVCSQMGSNFMRDQIQDSKYNPIYCWSVDGIFRVINKYDVREFRKDLVFDTFADALSALLKGPYTYKRKKNTILSNYDIDFYRRFKINTQMINYIKFELQNKGLYKLTYWSKLIDKLEKNGYLNKHDRNNLILLIKNGIIFRNEKMLKEDLKCMQ